VSFGNVNCRIFERNAEIRDTVDLGSIKFNDSGKSPARVQASAKNGNARASIDQATPEQAKPSRAVRIV